MGTGPFLTKDEIKSLCGSTSYSRGESYFRRGKVLRVNYDPQELTYHAIVKGSSLYDVSTMIDEQSGDVEAECDCPAFDDYYYYCKHIAAVLLQIEDVANSPSAKKSSTARSAGSSGQARASAFPSAAPIKPPQPPKPLISEQEIQLANRMLSLFASPVAAMPQTIPAVEAEEALVEFICRIEDGYRSRISIELKVGTSRRLYVVQKINDFLEKLEQGLPYSFSKLFTFHPQAHRFQGPNAEVMAQLLDTFRNERLFRDVIGSFYYYPSGDRALLIPPSAWQKLYPHLAMAPNVRYEVGRQVVGQLVFEEGRLPLRFELGEGPMEQAYRLKLEGLANLKLIPQYGIAVTAHGQVYPIQRDEVEKISRLQSMFGQSNVEKLTIPPAQLNAFLQQVVPALRQIGEFRVADQVADRVVNQPLKASVYLDRIDDVLTATVEFAYGEARIWPLRSTASQVELANRIVMRDAERERYVLDQLRQAGFLQKGEAFALFDEASIYTFLFNRLASLQQIAEVYATPAVDGLRAQRSARPRANVDLDAATNWLEVRFELDGVDEKELVRLLRSLREKKSYHRLSNGAFVSLEDESFRELGRLFDDLGIRKTELKGDKLRLPVVRGLSLDEHDGKSSSNIRLGKSLRQLLGNLINPDNLDFEPPVSLAPILRDYQRYGFQWLKMLGYYGFGGILADDMGLGKTLQTIAFLASERERQSFAGAPALIVCPASLVYNWRNELARFAPQLKAAVAAGAKIDRDAVLSDADEVDVLITSYPVLRRDVEWYEGRRFHTLVLDEAQAIKNSTTQTTQAVKTIAADRRFALTGTPVENRLEELWSIYDAVFPELFDGRKAFTDLAAEQVARKIRPFLLRRLKTDVLTELPDKIETLQTSELLPEQKKLYMAYLMQLQQETVEQLQEEGFQKSRMKILAGLTRLRQICCHPSLFVEANGGQSGKLDQLLELLEECLASGKRMLIFSQFTSMLALIRNELERRQWAYFYLDGSTKASERVELCDRFNRGDGGADLFLISLKAGGTGLNLTGADTVILYDLWWNPAVEQQAADRAHRIGQKNVVQVIRLMTEGTIEEKMHELQQRKKDLIDTVIQPGEEALSTLTEQEIRELLAL